MLWAPLSQLKYADLSTKYDLRQPMDNFASRKLIKKKILPTDVLSGIKTIIIC